MVDHRKFPYTSFPTGWYQVAWSHDVPDTGTMALSYFDRDMVLFRGAGGALHLYDAYCPHLGAHLGFGGTVEGESIRCPFHGWRFDENGRNCEIPYAGAPNKTRIAKWQVAEIGGLVLAWYSADRSGPTWVPDVLPELADDDAAYPEGGRLYNTWAGVRLKPQFIIENLVDAAHQKFVHGAHEVPEIASYEPDGATFRVVNEVVFGGNKKKSWLTPDGKPVSSFLRTQAWGLGLAIARFDIDGSIHIQATTPIDAEHCDSRATVLLAAGDVVDGAPTEGATRRFTHECKQYERDLPIWEHQRFVHPAPFPEVERERFTVLRNWCTQFYPEAAPGEFGRFRDDIPAAARVSAVAR
jgi:phenylpropionate dioxygenase-like ring-hydroxylating dioxygenase large terminal subunit